LPVGVFDDPEAFEPEVHDWASQRLHRFDVRDDSPRYERTDRHTAPVLGGVARWR
jgi:hypothetical protein